MGFNQKNYTRFFFAYWADGDMHNTVRDAPSPMSPDDLRSVESEIEMATGHTKPVITNFRRMNE